MIAKLIYFTESTHPGGIVSKNSSIHRESDLIRRRTRIQSLLIFDTTALRNLYHSQFV